MFGGVIIIRIKDYADFADWSIFTRLCQQATVKGNLVSDAYLAAMAIESGSEWISTDRDLSRSPGLKWRHPLDYKNGQGNRGELSG
jgi:predicted nucleic acid-binding protein